jgi:dihydrofolate synthase/folylpolyglutamate synthase
MSPSAGAADEADRWLLELENFGIRPGLERMRALLAELAIADRPTVHVAGTNGKTSTTLMCAAMLQRAGLRAGAYVSPHVESFADRVHIGGPGVDRESFARHAAAVRAAVERLPGGAGQFEALTAIALRAFAAADLDAQVLEAGLGGRLDATNAVHSDVQVLTSVGLDHQRWLGDTVEEIAAEKLAIVKDGGTLVLAPGLPDTVAALAREVAAAHAAQIVTARAVAPDVLADPAAAGSFQRQNLGVALAAARALLERHGRGADVRDEELVAAGEELLPLRGRLETISTGPLVVVDGAHNVQAAEALVAALDGVVGDRDVVAVVAFLADKEPAGILDVLARRCREFVATTTRNPRALDADRTAQAARATGLPVEVVPDPLAALRSARALAGPRGAVLVTGTSSLARELHAPGAAGTRSRF